MPQLASRINDFLVGLETVSAPRAHHVIQRHGGGDPKMKHMVIKRNKMKNKLNYSHSLDFLSGSNTLQDS